VIRFMADAGLNGAIAGGCRRREPAIGFLSADDANLEGVSDPGVLAELGSGPGWRLCWYVRWRA
jgi:hypothetical protein